MSTTRYVNFSLIPSALYADLPSTDKNVLVHIAKRADDAGEAWPSLETLVRDTGLSRRTVIYATKRLVKSGILALIRHGNQFSGSNKYRLDPIILTSYTADSYKAAVWSKCNSDTCSGATVALAPVQEMHPNRSLNIEGGPQATGIEQPRVSQYLESITGLQSGSGALPAPSEEVQEPAKSPEFYSCDTASSFPADSQELQPEESTVGIEKLPASPPNCLSTPHEQENTAMSITQPSAATAAADALCEHLSTLLNMPAPPDWQDHAASILAAGSLAGAMSIATWGVADMFWKTRLTGMSALARFIQRGTIVHQWRRAGSPDASTPAIKAPASIPGLPPNMAGLLAEFPMFNSAGMVARNFLTNTRAVVLPSSKNTGQVELFIHDSEHFIRVERVAFRGAHAWKITPQDHSLLPEVVSEIIKTAGAAWDAFHAPAPAPAQHSHWVN